MNEGRLKECWERTKDNGVLCRAGCIICVMAPCIEPCLFLLPRRRAHQDRTGGPK